MGAIHILDKVTVDKIAAGEVVERPSSVVKELVENAVDAKASAVTVEIKDGGISYLRVTDNGSGIAGEEISLAFLRHSTSKIRQVEDLGRITSLGFRGEALSSIAAVAQVEVVTKTQTAVSGIRYRIEGGEEKGKEDIGAPNGTTFLVRNLFYNVPARRKFLKSPITEAGYIASLIERLALSHPEISFKFINNGQTKLQTSGNTNLKDIIYHVYGREAAANLLMVSAEEENGMHLYGFLGKPMLSRGNRNYENYFVNGRYVKSPILFRAIEDAYQPYMMQHRYPFTVLQLQVDTEKVDINVHPTKMEVRFSENQKVYDFVYRSVAEALAGKEFIPEVSFDKAEGKKEQQGALTGQHEILAEQPAPYAQVSVPAGTEPKSDVLPGIQSQADVPPSPQPQDAREKNLEYFLEKMRERVTKEFEGNKDVSSREGQQLIQEARDGDQVRDRSSDEESHAQKEEAPQDLGQPDLGQLDLFEHRFLDKASRANYRIIGQVFDTYWLVQFEEKLYIIDQHAAHEKVLYERIMASMEDKEYTSQMISPPIILTLSMAEEEILLTYMDQFQQLGFEIEPFGGKEYAVRAVPANLFSLGQKDVLMEMLDALSGVSGHADAQTIRDRIATISCKAAVKGNNRLSVQEAEALIDELLNLENPYNCPHGRPTIISMTKYEMEKKFKRIV